MACIGPLHSTTPWNFKINLGARADGRILKIRAPVIYKNFKRIWTKTGLIWAKDSIQSSNRKSSLSAIGKPNGYSNAEQSWAIKMSAKTTLKGPRQKKTSWAKPGQAGPSLWTYYRLSTPKSEIGKSSYQNSKSRIKNWPKGFRPVKNCLFVYIFTPFTS